MTLHRYRAAAQSRRLPAYARSMRRRLGHVSIRQMSEEELWSLHNASSSKFNRGGVSLLDVKAELALRLLSPCRLCERRCEVDRLGGQTGFCGVGSESFYFFEQTLWGEEPPLIPSHEVFFSGCNLRCKFCYSWQSLLDPALGKQVMPEDFAELIAYRRREGAANLNLIGGEPTLHLPLIMKSLSLLDTPTPVVWNSNFLMSQETMHLLDGVVDLYLGDFRFGCNDCAERIGSVSGYTQTATRNFRLAAASGDLVIRHLVLPGHVECCLRPIADWVAENLPDVPFNLMFQYTPFFQALEDPELCRSLTPQEEMAALEIVKSRRLNINRWKRPLGHHAITSPIGTGEITTTITIRPDGQVGIMHLHGELLSIVEALKNGGCGNG